MDFSHLFIDSQKFNKIMTEYTQSIDKSLNHSTENLKKIPITLYNNKITEIYPCCATDGSYIVHWKYTKRINDTNKYFISNLHFCSLAFALVVQTLYKDDKNENAYKTEKYLEEIPMLIDLSKIPEDLQKHYPIQKVLEILMSARERFLLYQHSETHNRTIIMIDGSLYQPYSKNQTNLRRDTINTKDLLIISKCINFINKDDDANTWLVDLETLEQSCVIHDNILVGVAKDSKLKNNNGINYLDLFDIAVKVQNKSNQWCYYKPIDINNILAKNDATIIFAKLDPHAQISHRIDFAFTGFDLDTQVLPLISAYSKYKRIIGTPITPEVCHADVVKIRQLKDFREKDVYNYLKLAGFSIDEITMGLTDVNGELVNVRKFHDVLDCII